MTSKPSLTNCPNTLCLARNDKVASAVFLSLGLCQSNVTHTVDVPCSDEYDCCGCPFRKDISGGYCGGVPPLPIPNREVKPTYADGTAMQCGRVGSRLLL